MKSILLTGGTGVVGAALTEAFLRNGDSLVVTYHRNSSLQTLQASYPSELASGQLKAIQVDLSQPTAVAQLVSALSATGSAPEVLINNARSLNSLKTEGGVPSRENWHTEFTINVIVPWELTLDLARGAESRLRKVVNVSSIYGFLAPHAGLYADPGTRAPVHYAVSKAGVIQLTKELAVLLRGQEIAVNAVSFGGIRGRADGEFEKRYAALCPAGRMLEAHEVVEPIRSLIECEGLSVTGQNLIVDGGFSIW